VCPHQPDGLPPDLLWVLACSCHSSILSKVGASSRPGEVQYRFKAQSGDSEYVFSEHEQVGHCCKVAVSQFPLATVILLL
jgi:hypothetical protein